jgi:hypothetical protein
MRPYTSPFSFTLIFHEQIALQQPLAWLYTPLALPLARALAGGIIAP